MATRPEHRYVAFRIYLIIGYSLFAFTGKTQTLHAILVADTHDAMLKAVCKQDIEVMHRQFVQLASAINYELSEQVISGGEFSSKRLDFVLHNLSPKPNDILFLYYTGHGYNASQRAGRFPVLLLEKDEQISQQNPGLVTIHQLLKSKRARLCITMGDCCNHLVQNMRGMVKKTIVKKDLPKDSVNAIYRKLFLNVTGDALIASSQPPQQSCAHPDSGSFYTRSFNEALELASLYNKNITWETLLRDTQSRLNRHQATQTKQSIYEVNMTSTQATDHTQAPADAPKLITSDLPVVATPTLSFDQINRQLNDLTDETLSRQQRMAIMNRLTGLFAKQARVDIYVGSTLDEVQPIETFMRRLVMNADYILQINLIERLSEVAANGKQFKRVAIQEVLGQECPLPLNEQQVIQETQLSQQQLRDFRQLTEQKVAEFQRYLTVVADPDQQDNIRELAIENALMLFLPDARMQVSSSKTIREYPLAIYLRRLKNLDKKYADISITFYDIALLADWEKTIQGYQTTATYFQRFQAFDRKGQPVYKAKTAKHTDVDLRSRKDPFYEEYRWTVLLGNVRLAETPLKKGML